MTDEVFSDDQLIERALAGERRSFDHLYKRYEAKIYNFLYRLLGRREKAEEVMQDAFVQVFRNLNRYVPGKSAAPWIYRIAHNAALNYFRAEKKHRRDVSLELEESKEQQSLQNVLSSASESPEVRVREEEFQKALQRAIDSLPEKYKIVLILHDIEQKSYEEIQEILRIPYQTVATHLARARLLFRKKIDSKQFGIQWFISWGILVRGKMNMLEKWLVSEGDLTLFVDGRLDKRLSERFRSDLSQNLTWKESVLAMEEAKVLLSNLKSVSVPDMLENRILRVVSEEAVPQPMFGVVVANMFDMAWARILIVPRLLIFAVVASVLIVAVGVRIIQTESERILRVSEESQKDSRLKEIKPGEILTTEKGKTLDLRRNNLFTIKLESETKLKVDSLSHFGGFGVNQFSLETGTLLFKTEKALSKGDFNVIASHIRISNLGTIALINQSTKEQTSIAVLKGRLQVESLKDKERSVVVEPLQELVWNEASSSQDVRPISQEALEKLVDFSKSRAISLGLPEKYAARALVDSSQISVAFAFFNIAEPDRKALLDEAAHLFTKTSDLESVKRARNILEGLAVRYKKENRLDISAPMELFSAAISAYLKEDSQAVEILSQIFNNTRYDRETRALAQCALGILYERSGNFDAAKRAYQIIAGQFKQTSVSAEAKERLETLQK